MPVEERLASHDVFSFLRPEQIDVLSDAAEVVEYKAGDTVYYQGKRADYMYVVLKGEVSLRLPGKGGITIPIDVATPGVMFGSLPVLRHRDLRDHGPVHPGLGLMKIEAAVLRHMMDDDLPMGFAIQRRISHVYFERYLETMKKLQAIVMNLPIDTER